MGFTVPSRDGTRCSRIERSRMSHSISERPATYMMASRSGRFFTLSANFCSNGLGGDRDAPDTNGDSDGSPGITGGATRGFSWGLKHFAVSSGVAKCTRTFDQGRWALSISPLITLIASSTDASSKTKLSSVVDSSQSSVSLVSTLSLAELPTSQSKDANATTSASTPIRTTARFREAAPRSLLSAVGVASITAGFRSGADRARGPGGRWPSTRRFPRRVCGRLCRRRCVSRGRP